MGYHGIAKKLSVGFNSNREMYSGCGYGSHSEMDVLRKLKPMRTSRLTKIDIYVIRVNKRGERKNSKPCSKCVKHMANAIKKGYMVVDIYFSDINGDIVKTKFSHLYHSHDQFVSTYFRRRTRRNR